MTWLLPSRQQHLPQQPPILGTAVRHRKLHIEACRQIRELNPLRAGEDQAPGPFPYRTRPINIEMLEAEPVLLGLAHAISLECMSEKTEGSLFPEEVRPCLQLLDRMSQNDPRLLGSQTTKVNAFAGPSEPAYRKVEMPGRYFCCITALDKNEAVAQRFKTVSFPKVFQIIVVSFHEEEPGHKRLACGEEFIETIQVHLANGFESQNYGILPSQSLRGFVQNRLLVKRP